MNNDNDKIYVFLGIHQCSVDSIEAHRDKEGARQAFESFTGIAFEEFSQRLQKESSTEILGEKYEDCNVYKLTLH